MRFVAASMLAACSGALNLRRSLKGAEITTSTTITPDGLTGTDWIEPTTKPHSIENQKTLVWDMPDLPWGFTSKPSLTETTSKPHSIENEKTLVWDMPDLPWGFTSKPRLIETTKKPHEIEN